MDETKTYKVTVEEFSTTSTEGKNKPPTKNKWTIENKIALLSLFTAIAVGVVAFKSCEAMERNNRIIETANLLYIYDAIQTRLDACVSITDETEVMQTDAIYSFLNTFEFACLQYDNNKIDKESFKLFYKDKVFKEILINFDFWLKRGNYPYIRKICEEWGWNIF
jgi:hypothetical protein